MAKNIIVSTHDPLHPIIGGGALRTLKAAEEFKKRGHNVKIVAPTDGKNMLSGIETHWLHAPRKQRSSILSSIKFNTRLLIKFIKFAKKTDIFFIHNTIAAMTIPFLKKIYPFKFALDITDIHAEYLLVGKRNMFEKILTPIILMVEYWVINCADSITVATKEMKNLLVEKGIDAKKIEVVYDGAEIDHLSTEKEPGSNFNIIHLGSVDRQHGVEIFIHAIPGVVKKMPNVKFFIVGGGRELPNIKKLADELGISKNCIFTDYLPCQQAREYLKKAKIGIIPREDTLPNRIITTLKLYEYWASATAIISSRLAGIEEIAQDKKDILFFTSGDSKDLSEKIIFLLESPEMLEKIRNEGSSTVKKFSWNIQIPKIVDFVFKE
ncbi:MAG: glycosyltransferase family 4 protein [Elusimicrobia bacterium]|nr:glycosyltransferase family 4 protein [Elusimicrobiota bacterium]